MTLDDDYVDRKQERREKLKRAKRSTKQDVDIRKRKRIKEPDNLIDEDIIDRYPIKGMKRW